MSSETRSGAPARRVAPRPTASPTVVVEWEGQHQFRPSRPAPRANSGPEWVTTVIVAVLALASTGLAMFDLYLLATGLQ
jgi:hypothetical protein